ncbi:Tryptophan synthase alpha chain [Minicystis rosea]|nr:Tryptophan synthase alpha chain [Minicystis rosea]
MLFALGAAVGCGSSGSTSNAGSGDSTGSNGSGGAPTTAGSGGTGATSASSSTGVTSSTGGAGGSGGSTGSTGGTGGSSSSGGTLCVPGETTSCYTGPSGTEGVGVCKSGVATCNDTGTAFGACIGEVTPGTELCSTPEDDDCNGQANEGCPCTPGTTASCYSGPPGTEGVGNCVAGTKTCNDDGTGYGPCVGEVLPQPESCYTREDDDCNGQKNEGGDGCVCTPYATASCYDGPAGTEGVGACHAGTKTCNDLGTVWGPCVGEVLPQAETCNTPVDDDCNGQINESGVGCSCVPNTTASCYSGPAGTIGVGPCQAGTQTCNAQGTGYGPCMGEVTPQPETCATPIDDDCNGQTNEGGAGCVCLPNATTSCYSGPPGTQGVGICKAGTQTCNAMGTANGACTGEVTPQAESCNTTADDNCDGQVNEGCGDCVFSRAVGSAIDDEGFSLVSDATGNLFIGTYVNATVDFGCGPLSTAATLDGAMIGKFTSSGACLWNKVAGTGSAHTQAVGLDPAGNVYATGYFQGTMDWGCGVMTSSGTQPDVFVTKLNGSNGACLWSKRAGDASPQYGNGIAVDTAGNVYLTGMLVGQLDLGGGPITSAGNNDVFVAKLDTNGNQLWGKRFGDGNTQVARALTLDGASNVLVTGQFAGSIGFGGPTLTSNGLFDAFLIKLDTNGNHVWSKQFGDAADQIGIGVAVDRTNDAVLAVGTFAGTINLGGAPLTSLGGNDAYVVKLDTSGNHVWSKAFGGPNNQNATTVAVDANGYIVVAGQLLGSADFGGGTLASAGNGDVWLGRYDPSGNHLWSKRYGDAATQSPASLSYDNNGNILLVGFLMGATDFGCGAVNGGGGEDVFFVKLTP